MLLLCGARTDPPTRERLYGFFGDRYSKSDSIGFQVWLSEFELHRALLLLLHANKKEFDSKQCVALL